MKNASLKLLLGLIFMFLIMQMVSSKTNTTFCEKNNIKRQRSQFLKVLVTIISNENFECLSINDQKNLLKSFQNQINNFFAD